MSIEQDEDVEVNTKPLDQSGTINSELPSVGAILLENRPFQNGANPSPSYVEIIKKKPVDSYGSSEEDSIEKNSKKAGWKSRKEAREEEAERLKMQGRQSTIEMSLGKSKRNRPPKGVITPSLSSK